MRHTDFSESITRISLSTTDMNSTCFVSKRPPLASRLSVSSESQHSSTSVVSKSALWRPWDIVNGIPARGGCPRSTRTCPYSRLPVSDRDSSSSATSGNKLDSFQHPVRLFWPKSKSFDYLYSDGETLLRNFPVQATISFYEESDSDSEEDEEDEEEEEEELLAAQKENTLEAHNTHTSPYLISLN